MRYDASQFNMGNKTYSFMDLKPGDVFVFSGTVYMLLWWGDGGRRVHVLRVADVSENKLLTRPANDTVTWEVASTLTDAKILVIKAELKLLSYE